MSVKFTKELKKFENHENKREKKMYDFILKPTWLAFEGETKRPKQEEWDHTYYRFHFSLTPLGTCQILAGGEGGWEF